MKPFTRFHLLLVGAALGCLVATGVSAAPAVVADKEQAGCIRWNEERQRLIVTHWTGKARPLTITIQPLHQQ